LNVYAGDVNAPKEKLIWWLACPCILLLILIALGIQRIVDVAAIQNSVSRNWELGFDSDDPRTGRPRDLPAFVDEPVQHLFDWMFDSTVGTTNKQVVYDDLFRSLFRGPIHGITIYEPHMPRGDVGAALLRFPHLQQVWIGLAEQFTASDWTLLCKRLRLLPELQDVDLDGNNLTDTCIIPLSGHPRLRKITIGGYQLTPMCLKTLSTLPSLTDVTIDQSSHFKPEDQKAMAAALPAVTFDFSGCP